MRLGGPIGTCREKMCSLWLQGAGFSRAIQGEAGEDVRKWYVGFGGAFALLCPYHGRGDRCGYLRPGVTRRVLFDDGRRVLDSSESVRAWLGVIIVDFF